MEIIKINPIRSATKESATGWDPEPVEEFAERHDILVLPRHPRDTFGEVVDGARIHEYFAPVNRETAAREIRFGLGEFRIRSNDLAADLTELATSFLNQFEIEEARLRIEITRKQSCPKFHCDNVNVRMVTTYVGPTTEYQYVAEDTIHTAPLFGLVFLKGRRYPNHRDSVHHRSPEVAEGVKRLCVAIDY